MARDGDVPGPGVKTEAHERLVGLAALLGKLQSEGAELAEFDAAVSH